MEIITKLEQYYSMKQEAKDLRQRIEAGERYLAEMGERGMSGIRHSDRDTKRWDDRSDLCHRLPDSEYRKIKTMTKKRIARLKILEEELIEAMNQVDDFINRIPKSELG